MVDYNAEKTLEELVFAFIPIWVRVSKMPFGMMNKATGEAIGREMGELGSTSVSRFELTYTSH
jgi:hypothetical protein